MPIVLKPHQVEALEFLTANSKSILGDRRGAGKTYPALAAVRQNSPQNGHFLYVCPAYQMIQNGQKIRDMYPEDTVSLVMRGDKPDPEAQWHVVSYHTLTDPGIKATPWLMRAKWDAIIFDEGHRLRGRKSQWTKNAQVLAARVKRVHLLTGTPMVKDPGDYWAQLRVLDYSNFRSYWNFVEEWCSVVTNPWKTEITGLRRDKEPQFARLLAKYMLRRDITLPEPTENNLPVQPEAAISREHARAKKEWTIQIPGMDEAEYVTSGAALVIRLRQLTAKSQEKTKAVAQILEDLPDEQVILYTWFRESSHHLEQELLKTGDIADRIITRVSGADSAQDRVGKIEQWKSHPRGILLATISSIQEGLDLQNAAVAIFYEVPYTWADCDQAIGRVHREGQTRQVSVYYIRAKGTVDVAVHRAMMARREGAQNLDTAMRSILNDVEAGNLED